MLDLPRGPAPDRRRLRLENANRRGIDAALDSIGDTIRSRMFARTVIRTSFEAGKVRTLMASTNDDERLSDQWYDLKSSLMEKSLGPEHDVVMHAIIPYAIGGGLDLYYFPNGLSGTAIATKELSEDLDECSRNDVYDRYELVMFTRHALDLDSVHDASTAFGRAHGSINAILNCMAPYSAQATLNPRETCEFPANMEKLGGRCLVFADYARHKLHDGDTFGLLALVEIFRSEMEYARENGGEQLLQLLKQNGHYPFSDLDRVAVA